MSVTQLVSTIHVKDSITFTLNSQFLNHNFQIVKQCLLRIKDLESQIGKSKQDNIIIQKKVGDIQQKINHNSESIHNNSQKIKELSSNVGDDFMKKMYAIEQKTKNIYDFNQTVRKIQQLNKFLPTVTFNQYVSQTQKQMDKIMKLQDQFKRYVPNITFQEYKSNQQIQLNSKQRKIDELQLQIQQVDSKINQMNDNFQKVRNQLSQNNQMIKQINFSQMLEKQKLYKEELETKVSEMSSKLKKRVTHGELNALEKSMIEKLDKFLGQNERNKAQKIQTKGALQFLQKRINQLSEIIIEKLSDEDKDALFTAKKIQCASCTKDLGKFQGKLGQYRPWSIFPCKQLDPQKSGGFGYLNYIDKMSYKKGFELQDQNLERLNKTLSDPRQKETPSKKLNSTRASNLISNFGSEERGSSLKDAYFKQVISDKGQRVGGTSRNFRVSKKEPVKQIVEQQTNNLVPNK